MNSNKKEGLTVWLTGLSVSGKSTISMILERELKLVYEDVFVIDGDVLRKGLCSNLGFSSEDREENIRRATEVSKLFMSEGYCVVVAMISPIGCVREEMKLSIGKDRVIEVFVDTPIDECIKRDVKGLYEKVKNGEIKNFTGIDAPYERPSHPDLRIETILETPEESSEKIFLKVLDRLQEIRV